MLYVQNYVFFITKFHLRIVFESLQSNPETLRKTQKVLYPLSSFVTFSSINFKGDGPFFPAQYYTQLYFSWAFHTTILSTHDKNSQICKIKHLISIVVILL